MSILDSVPEGHRGRVLLAGGAGIAALLVVLLLWMRTDSPNGGSGAAPTALTVTASMLKTVTLPRGVTANGSIHAWQEIIIGPEVGGYRVAAVNVDVGDHVKKGQELVRLADELLIAEVASKRANVEQARATLDNAQAAYRRAQALGESGALSPQDLDRLRSEELAARARVAVSEADLEAAELRLRHTRVTAPDSGIISARNVNVGQVAQVGAEMLRLLRQGRVEWRAEIPEARVRDIKLGQKVTLTTADGTRIEGTVRAVPPIIDSATRAGLVYVDLPVNDAVRPGMFARGDIILEQSEAQMAPIGSVVIQDGYSYVFVLGDDNKVQRRRVTTGVVENELIEIVEGVAPDERIVDKGAGFLKDGDEVTVVDAEPT
jgi:HlyD family secretion protein